MKRVGIYIRVSTQDEKQLNAFEIQKEELVNYVKSQEDWELQVLYEDKGISGTESSKRKAYQRMTKDIKNKVVDIIVIKDEYRLNRNTLEGLKYLRLIIENNVQLFFYLDRKWYDRERDLDIKIKFVVAEEQSKDLSKKINNAHQTRMKKGRICTNGKLWGYIQRDGQLIIDEKQAEIVKLVFQLYASGQGYRKIEQELKNKDIKNQKGNDFSMTTLKRMIRNPKYKGTVIMNTNHKDFYTKKIIRLPEEEWIIHENACPSIISKELWEQANQLLEKKRRKFNVNEKIKLAGYWGGSYLYSSKIYCGKCGKVYWHQKYGNMKNDLWQCSTYRKFGKNDMNGCNNSHIYTYVLDEIVKEVIYDYWQDKDKAINNVLRTLEKSLEDSDYSDTNNKLKTQINKFILRNQNLLEMRMDGEISKVEFAVQKQKLDVQLSKYENEIKELEEKNKQVLNKKKRLEDIKKYTDKQVSGPKELTNDIISYFLEKIVIDEEDNIRITLIDSFETIYTKKGKEFKRENVSIAGSNRFTRRSCKDKL